MHLRVRVAHTIDFLHVRLLKCVKMLDHVMIKVKDWSRAKAYYEKTLPHIGYELFWDNEKSGGFQGPDAPHGRIYIVQGMFDSAVCCEHTTRLFT